MFKMSNKKNIRSKSKLIDHKQSKIRRSILLKRTSRCLRLRERKRRKKQRKLRKRSKGRKRDLDLNVKRKKRQLHFKLKNSKPNNRLNSKQSSWQNLKNKLKKRLNELNRLNQRKDRGQLLKLKLCKSKWKALKNKDWLIQLKKKKLKRRQKNLLNTKSCSKQLKQHLLLLVEILLQGRLPVNKINRMKILMT